MSVIEKAKELGQMIVESDEFIALQKAEIKQNNDAKAIELISNYNVKRNEYMEQMQDSNLPKEQMEEIKQKMEDEFKVLSENETISQYITATQNFQQMMNSVNSVLSHYINGDQQGGCDSGDCGGCSGCH